VQKDDGSSAIGDLPAPLVCTLRAILKLKHTWTIVLIFI